MGRRFPLAEMAAAQRELRIAEANRLAHWNAITRRLEERGEVPAFSFEGLERRLEHLKATEQLLALLAPYADRLRQLDQALADVA